MIYSGGRAELARGEALDAFALAARPRISDPRRVIGAKPAPFLFWLFSLLGARPGDHFDDLFPGSGGVMRAWELWNRRATTAVVQVDPEGARRALKPTPVIEHGEQLPLLAVPRRRRPSARARRTA